MAPRPTEQNWAGSIPRCALAEAHRVVERPAASRPGGNQTAGTGRTVDSAEGPLAGALPLVEGHLGAAPRPAARLPAPLASGVAVAAALAALPLAPGPARSTPPSRPGK